MLKTAIAAAHNAGQVIIKGAADLSVLNIEQKSRNDFVSEVDRDAEAEIVNAILEVFPKHAILGEEYGEQGEQDSDYKWVIDPLDGTTNFLNGIPHYAVSIALLYRNEVEHAVVYDPTKQELFTASKGLGVRLNGSLINMSPMRSSLKGGLYATGIPFNGEMLANIRPFVETMQDVLALQTSGIRRMGAAALDLAYVAVGRFDGFWEAGLKPWDMAAGALLVKESGGLVSDFQGNNHYLASGNIIAGARVKEHQRLLDIVSKNY